MPGFFSIPQYLRKAKYLNKNLFGYPTHKLEKKHKSHTMKLSRITVII